MENQPQNQLSAPVQTDEQFGLQIALDTFRQQRNQAHDQVVDLQANLAVMDRRMRAAELRAEQAKKLAQTFRDHTLTLRKLLTKNELEDEIPEAILKDLTNENDAQSGDSAVPAP